MHLRSIILLYLGRKSSRHPGYSELKQKADSVFRFWQRIIFWLVLFAGSSLIYFAFHFHGLVSEEAMELAGIGRNIAMGRGFVSSIESPCFLYRDSSVSNYLSPSPPPLYCWIQAISFRIAGYKDSSAVLGGVFFFMAASLLTYALALRLYPRKVALYIFLFTFTNPVLLRNSITGLPTAFLSFLVVLLFYGMDVLPKKSSAGLGGVVLGVGFLSDYSWSFLLIPFLLYYIVFNRKDRLANIGIFLAGFIVVISPWIIGEIRAGQSSYFINLDLQWKSSTGLFPAQSARGLYGLSFQSVYLTLPLIIGKIHHGLSLLYREGLVISGNFIGLLFWASLFFGIHNKRIGAYKYLLCLLLGGAGVWFVIAGHRPEVLPPFLPLIILFGTGFFFDLIDRFSSRKKMVCYLILSGFILLNCWPSLIAGWNVPGRDRKDTLDSLNYLRSLIREDEVVATDLPGMVGWYGYRRAVRIPLNIPMFEEMIRDHSRLKFLLLSPRIMEEFGLDPTGQWRQVYLNKSLPGKTPLDQIMLLPGRLELMGRKAILLNRISSRW